MSIALVDQLQADLPPMLQPIFPYRLVTKLLHGSGDGYVTMLARESFHACQGMMAPGRPAAAETVVNQEDRYPWDDAGLQDSW